MRGLSVIICCHNSQSRIADTLHALQQQKCLEDLRWEVLLVDNASDDNTVEVAQEIWEKSPVVSMRIVSENKLGLSYARTKGVSEARYSYVSFIDDDNWVCNNWVAKVYTIFEENPEVGACGGLNKPVFEVEPPHWFNEFQKSYAVGPQAEHAGDITWSHGVLCGAGLSIRVSAWQELFANGFMFNLVGRQGGKLLCGEYYEFCHALRLTGWKIWYEPDLTLDHFIPRTRLSWVYLRKMIKGFGFVRHRLSAYGYGKTKETILKRRLWAWPCSAFFLVLKSLEFGVKAIWLRILLKDTKRATITFDLAISELKEVLWLKGQYNLFAKRIFSANWNKIT